LAFHRNALQIALRFLLYPSSFILLLACCFSTSATAQPPTTSLAVSVTSSNSCADDKVWENDQQSPQDNDSSPDSTSDFDDNDDSSDDASATTLTRHNQLFSAQLSPLAQTFGVQPSSFSLRLSLGTVPDFLLPTQSLICLHDRIRERAPPLPASHRSQA
jgi:hypothetical protein